MSCSSDCFHLDANVTYNDGFLDGYYRDSGETQDGLPVYFIDGMKVEESYAVYSYASYEPVSKLRC